MERINLSSGFKNRQHQRCYITIVKVASLRQICVVKIVT